MESLIVTFRNEMHDLSCKLLHLIELYEETKKEIHKLQCFTSSYEQCAKKIFENIKSSKKECENLKSDVNYLKSLQRKDNLIVCGIPYSQYETQDDLISTMKKIAAVSGVDLNSDDISNIYRLRESITRTSQGRPNYPLIMVKFTKYSEAKQKIFRNYLKQIGEKIPLRCSQLGMSSSNRIYLNHHLTPLLLRIREQATGLRKLGVIERTIPRYDAIKILLLGKWYSVTTVEQLDKLTSSLLPIPMSRGG